MVNRVLTELKLEKHPQKTFIGRAEKCFEFIGFAFGVDTVTIATKTLSNSLTRITRLYEQKAPSQRIWEIRCQILAMGSNCNTNVRVQTDLSGFTLTKTVKFVSVRIHRPSAPGDDMSGTCQLGARGWVVGSFCF